MTEAMIERRVVFPQPEGPTSIKSSAEADVEVELPATQGFVLLPPRSA